MTVDNIDNKIGFRALSPEDNMAYSEAYIGSIKEVFNNPNIKNIAISGPYGCGKSSIIDTFLTQNKDVKEKSRKVSMATFSTMESHNNTEDSEEQDKKSKSMIKTEKIEKYILKQLFYSISPEKIPQSRYRKIVKLENDKIFIVTFFICSVIAMAGTFLYPLHKRIAKFIEEGISLNLCTFENLTFVYIALWVIVALCISYLYKRLIPRFKIKSFGLGKAKAEIQSDTTSFFDRNLDEIIYFFEQTGYRYVFFEDFDRLDNIEIFEELRMLNNILNNDEDMSCKPIRFVYAVKDDLFPSAEARCKFFDIILPVVPVVAQINSAAWIMTMLKEDKNKYGREYHLTVGCIFTIAQYIFDMRVLKNIWNEFILYREILSRKDDDDYYNSLINEAFEEQDKLKLDDDKLFCLIAVKNLYLNDFADLQRDDGVIKNAFEKKRELVDAVLKETKQENYQFSNEADKTPLSQILEVCEKESPEIIKNVMRDICEKPMLMELLRKGYVDKGYCWYISYFVNAIFTACDQDFIIAVKDGKKLDYEYELIQQYNIIRFLELEDFSREEVYNYYLVGGLLNRYDEEFKEKADKFFSSIVQKYADNKDDFDKNQWKFIDGFILWTQSKIKDENIKVKFKSLFIQILAKKWTYMWEYISRRYSSTDISSTSVEKSCNKQIFYLREIIEACCESSQSDTDEELLQKYPGVFNSHLREFLENHKDILQKLENVAVEKLKLMIEVLKPKFTELVTAGVDEELIKFIIDKGLYDSNLEK